MRLDAPTREDVEKVRIWRNDPEVRSSLRTPHMITKESQEEFYLNLTKSNHRYWSIRDGDLVGFGGLTNISWENQFAEISLILAPGFRGQGRGRPSVNLILEEGFDRMGLTTVFGEVYHTNPKVVEFWESITKDLFGYLTILPNRKFYNGTFYNATYFSIDVEGWFKCK